MVYYFNIVSFDNKKIARHMPYSIEIRDTKKADSEVAREVCEYKNE